MAYDEELASRAKEILEELAEPREQKMFGGIAFMVNDHMCVGVINEDLVLRLGDEEGDAALEDPNVRPMDFTGRPMKNFLFVSPEGVKKENDLRGWITQAHEFVLTLPPKKPKKT